MCKNNESKREGNENGTHHLIACFICMILNLSFILELTIYMTKCHIIPETLHKKTAFEHPRCFTEVTYMLLQYGMTILNFEFADKYVKKNKQIKYFKLILCTYWTPHLKFVSHTKFKFDEIAKPFKYLYYLEKYVNTA